MKKEKLILVVFMVANLFLSKAQIACYDAVALKKCINGATGQFNQNKINEVDSILSHYLKNEYQSVSTAFGNESMNPFTKNLFSNAVKHSAIPYSPSKLLSSAGELYVTNFADGMAKFIVKRTKQELSTAFFERFKQDLDRTKQIQLLFPSTYNVLKVIDSEIYNYTAYLDLFRESFQKDLTLLLPDIHTLINDPCMNKIFNESPGLKILLSDALSLTTQFSEGKHPGDVIHNYISFEAKKESLDKIDPDLFSSIQILDLFSQSLRSKQTDRYWISPDSLNLLFDATTFQIYLGLIYQQAANTSIVFESKKFTDYIKESGSKVDIYKPYLTNIIAKGESVNYYFNTIKDKQSNGKDKPVYQDYYSLFDASLNLIEYVTEKPGLVNLKVLNTNDSTLLSLYFKSLRSLNAIYVDIYEKQYTSAIVEFSSMYSDVLNRKLYRTIDNSVKQELQNQQKVVQLVIKYGNFAASMAKAENSDEVNNAIEAIALPAGSARIKRESIFNVSVNAYCGLFAGQNRMRFWSAPEYTAGVTAPIGIAASLGTHHHSSFSLFVSIIDLGAPVTFRFSNSTDTVPTLKLRDIISPGLFLSWGIPGGPVSINAGCQLTPLLTEVSQKENTFGAKTLRFTISACVDLPLLNIYNKSR